MSQDPLSRRQFIQATLLAGALTGSPALALAPALEKALTTTGITDKMPGWAIVKDANLLPPPPSSTKVMGDEPDAALKKLMTSFYEYGRKHWTWSQSSPQTAGNGGLVKGLADNCACATFNLNLKFLAEKVCGITGIGQETLTSQFLTLPGGVPIDTKWHGNVRSDKEDFAALKCFKFAQHYWLSHAGHNYDVCYNKTFARKEDIIWTLLLPDTGAGKKKAASPAFKLAKPLPYADRLVMVVQDGANHWPTWKLVKG